MLSREEGRLLHRPPELSLLPLALGVRARSGHVFPAAAAALVALRVVLKSQPGSGSQAMRSVSLTDTQLLPEGHQVESQVVPSGQ